MGVFKDFGEVIFSFGDFLKHQDNHVIAKFLFIKKKFQLHLKLFFKNLEK